MGAEAIDVRIWQGRIAGIPLRAQLERLTAAERARARRYRHERDGNDFARTRGILRAVLAQVTGQRPRDLVILEGDRKPVLRDFPRIHFSVSRSRDVVAIAVAEAPIGVDVEVIRDDFESDPIIDAFFHVRERAAVRRLSGRARTEAFFEIWTLKEAFVKALGCGVGEDLSRFATSLGGGPITADGRSPAERPWFGTVLATPPGHRLSLVTPWPAPRTDTLAVATA